MIKEYLEILKFYIIELPYFSIWKIFNRPKDYRIYCNKPFMAQEIDMKGDIFLCCPALLPYPIGNIKNTPLRRAFNSIMARRIRMSMYYGTPEKYCNKYNCVIMNTPGFKGISDAVLEKEAITKRTFDDIKKRRLFIADGAARLLEGISEVCNVECLFCWTAYKKNGNHSDLLEIFEKEILLNKDTIKVLSFSGGEPLIQKHVRNILRNVSEKDNIMFHFTSNLNCIDEEMKALLRKVRFYAFHVSLNAGTADTYPKIVRKGNWYNVMENWKFLMELRKKENFYLTTSMVVTTVNYKDILDFVKFSLASGVDKAMLPVMNDYGVNSRLQLTDADLLEIRKILEDPFIKENSSRIASGSLESYIHDRLMNIPRFQANNIQYKKMLSDKSRNKRINEYLSQIKKTDKRYAIYGAGLWTAYILEIVHKHNLKMPEIILDDKPSKDLLYSVKVSYPDKSLAADFDEILLGTDTYQEQMKKRIKEVFGNKIPVVDII